MSGYDMKIGEELFWSLIVAGFTMLAQLLAETDPATVGDWRVWAVGIAAGVARAVLAAGIAASNAPREPKPESEPVEEPVPQGESLSIRASRDKPYTLVVNGQEYVRVDRVQP